MTNDLAKKYQQQKTEFLDNLQPDDFRNGASFNQAETIIDQLNKALYANTLKQGNSLEFIAKAVNHLFRQNSEAAEKAIVLAQTYLKMREEK